MHIKPEASERHTLSVTVDNEAGILARIGLDNGQGGDGQDGAGPGAA